MRSPAAPPGGPDRHHPRRRPNPNIAARILPAYPDRGANTRNLPVDEYRFVIAGKLPQRHNVTPMPMRYDIDTVSRRNQLKMPRIVLALLILLLLAPFQAVLAQTPILFVHGNGDSASHWMTTLWRFESNGYPRARLHTIDFRNPTARSDDTKPQPFRSSSEDQLTELSARIEEVLRVNRASKLVLIGAQRGGLVIRNYLQSGGASKVSHAILAGTPNHGVIASSTVLVGSEYNAYGPLLRRLNGGPSEVVPGVRYLTLRSDFNDKFAQPDGRYLGLPGVPTNVGFDSPALAGANNVVLPGLDHRELAFHPTAFREMYRFLTGKEPRLDIVPMRRPVLDGVVSGLADGVPTNIPVSGAKVEIYEVSPATGERIGQARYRRTTGPDGRWGPFHASPTAFYEFVLDVPGYPVTHIYRSPFPRSSAVVHLRPGRFTEADQGAGSIVTLSRPRGYFGHGRDTFLLDSIVPPGVPPGVPSVGTATLRLPEGPMRPVRAVVNEERLTVRNWPAAAGHVVIAEVNE